MTSGLILQCGGDTPREGVSRYRFRLAAQSSYISWSPTSVRSSELPEPSCLWIVCASEGFTELSNILRVIPQIIARTLLAIGRCGSYAVLKMSIRVPLESEQEVFGPDTIAVLTTALEDTLHHLRLFDRNDPTVTKVAKKIIELARQGERDPIRLRNGAIQWLR